MKKSLIIVLTVIMLMTAGCSNSRNGKVPVSSATENVSVADKWEYEVYIDNIDYYMAAYSTALEDEYAAIENQDIDELEKAYKKCVSALKDFYDIPCPDSLKEEHDEFMTLIDRDKTGYELLLEAIHYERNSQNLTASEQEEMTKLEAEIDEHFSYTEDPDIINLWDAKVKLIEAASKFI